MKKAVSSMRGDLQSTLDQEGRLLLANFSVYSMDSHVVAAAPPSLIAEVQIDTETKYFDSSSPSVRLTVSLDSSNVAFFSGDGSRGGSSQPLASRMEEDGVGAAESRLTTAREDEEASEVRLCDEIVDEARRMEASARGVLREAVCLVGNRPEKNDGQRRRMAGEEGWPEKKT